MSFASHVHVMLTTFKRARGVAATYVRANGHEIPLTLVPAKKTSLVMNNNTRLSVTTHDFLELVENLVDDGEPFLPERGEQVVVADAVNAEATVTYEVLPDAGLPHWEYFDTTRRVVRIRTSLVSE